MNMMPRSYLFGISFLFSLLLASPAVVTGSIPSSANRFKTISAPNISSDEINASSWNWKTLIAPKEAAEIKQPKSYEINFAKDGTLSVKADCNRASGSYKLERENITINMGPATQALCNDEGRGEQLLQLLATATSFAVSGNTLIIRLAADKMLVFKAPSIAERCPEKVREPRSLNDTIDRKVSGELDKILSDFATGEMAAPGAAMLVITPKGQYFKAAGVADAAKCTLLKADSHYQIGSNTKLMTSAIIFQLHEAKQLSVSDKISKYLPEIAAKLQNGNDITIDMLLTHTSGLMDYFDVNNGDGGIAGGTANKSILTRGYRPEELIDLVAKSGKSEFKPGETGKWKYCNTGFVLLGMIIEKVTRRSYEANLKSRIFKPIKLKKTYLQTGQPVKGTLPEAYYQQPFTFTTSEWNASQGWSAGAVVSTSQEFAVFLKALFTGKLFTSKATLNLMRANPLSGVNALGPGTVYGHGMLNNSGILGHGGQTLGFLSDGGYIPEKDTTIVMWSNSATSMVNRLVVPGIAKIILDSQR